MGVYNTQSRDKEILLRAIESILLQTFDDFEFIICDDGSTDGTWNILRELSKQDNRIQIIKNESNKGLAGALNHALSIAKGDFIARMDDDDISLSNRFYKQIQFLREYPHYSILGCRVSVFDDNGIWGQRSNIGERNNVDIIKGNTFVHPSVMIRRDVLCSIGGYTESEGTLRCEDYDLWCKLYSQGYKGYVMGDVLLNYREDKEAYKKRKFNHRINYYRLKKKYFVSLNIPRKYYPYVYKPIIVGLIPPFILRLMKRILS